MKIIIVIIFTINVVITIIIVIVVLHIAVVIFLCLFHLFVRQAVLYHDFHQLNHYHHCNNHHHSTNYHPRSDLLVRQFCPTTRRSTSQGVSGGSPFIILSWQQIQNLCNKIPTFLLCPHHTQFEQQQHLQSSSEWSIIISTKLYRVSISERSSDQVDLPLNLPPQFSQCPLSTIAVSQTTFSWYTRFFGSHIFLRLHCILIDCQWQYAHRCSLNCVDNSAKTPLKNLVYLAMVVERLFETLLPPLPVF